MNKYTCTMMSISDIYYATLIAENDDQAKEMAAVDKQFFTVQAMVKSAP